MTDEQNDTTDETQAQVPAGEQPDAEPKADEVAATEADEATATEAADVQVASEDEVEEVVEEHDHDHGDHDHDHVHEAAEPAPGAPRPASRPGRQRNRGARPEGEAPVVCAVAKYVRTTPRKARLIADLIRDKDVEEARAILAHSTRSAAQDWSKVLESAVANAENNHELIGDELRIRSITADDGPTLKRFQPRAQGRAYRINKRTSHLTVQLTTKDEA